MRVQKTAVEGVEERAEPDFGTVRDPETHKFEWQEVSEFCII